MIRPRFFGQTAGSGLKQYQFVTNELTLLAQPKRKR